MTNELISGRYGQGWHVIYQPQSTDQSAVLSVWFLDLPNVHPFWRCYMISMVHLRDIPGGKPVIKHAPDNSHELVIYALNPELSPRYDDMTTWQPLTPVNMVQQFGDVTDEQAIGLIHLVVEGLLDGVLPIEPQGIRGALELWSESIHLTIDTIRRRGLPTVLVGGI